MPVDLFAETAEEMREEAAVMADTSNRVNEITRRLELFRDNPLWNYLTELLEAEQRLAFEGLFTVPPEQIPAVRERVRFIRYLVGLPTRLEEERARLTSDDDVEEE